MLRRVSILAALACTACSFSPDPDKRNLPLAGLEPELPASAVEVVAELPMPPGNLAVGPDQKVYFTFHPEAAPETHLAVVEPGGKWRPYPDAGWQSEREDQPYFMTPLAVRVDAHERLWVLDHADYGCDPPSLTAFDLKTNAMVHRFEFPSDLATFGSMLNDFAVDSKRGFIYIADTSAYDFDPALVVYDIANQRAWRVLEDHASVDPQDHHLVVQGRFMKVFGVALQLGVDSIAISADGEYLYYGPLSGGRMYRIATAALRNTALDDEALGAKVEDYGPKPSTDGVVMSAAGDIYLTAIEYDSIAILRPDRKLAVLAHDKERIAWPDGLSLSPGDTHLYMTISELHHVIGEDLDELAPKAPFRILRIALPKKGP